MEYRAVVFDIDGMLNHGVRFSERFSRKYSVNIEDMLPFFKGPFNECLVGARDLKDAIRPYLDQWNFPGSADDAVRFWLEGEVSPDEQMFDLAQVITKQIPCVVATNQERYRTEFLEETLQLNDIFERVYSSARLGSKKPQAQFFWKIIRDYGHRADQIIFWDDDVKNVKGAQDLGFTAHQFTSAVEFMQGMERYGFKF